MARPVVVDTGPIVALVRSDDQFHAWVLRVIAGLSPPLLTCEAVVAEAWFLLGRTHGGREALAGLLDHELVRVAFRFDDERKRVVELMRKYADVPMSPADACLVRMCELSDGYAVLTLDSDFAVYRKLRDQAVPVIAPTG